MPSPPDIPAPFRDFDVEPIVQLALSMQSGFEKQAPCERCREANERLLRYALTGALEACGFELIRRIS